MSSSNPSTAIRIRAFLGISSLILASMACQVDLGGPGRPGAPIEASSQDAQNLEEHWAGALAIADAQGDISLKIDEAQLTSFVALRFQQGPDLGLENIQVYLRDGQIQFFATLDRGIVRASILLGIEPKVDSDGNLSFEVTSADFGPVPMPNVLKNSISTAISEALAGTVGPLATGIDIKSVVVSDGEMTLAGRFR